jgi:hypothetical protein
MFMFIPQTRECQQPPVDNHKRFTGESAGFEEAIASLAYDCDVVARWDFAYEVALD